MANDSGDPGELTPIFGDEQAETRIRHVWHDGRWFWSIVDVVAVLIDSPNPGAYWRKLKQRLREDEGARETVTNCHELKMLAADGKYRLTDSADTETILRIIESVPSPKAEPVKRFLARVGNERLQEMGDPSLAADRMRRDYERMGYSSEWIRARLENVATRDELTTEWRERGAREGREFAVLTDTLSRGTFDITTAEHKAVKGLRGNANLRDNMTTLEIALTTLAEATSTAIHQANDSHGMGELRRDATEAGDIAGAARQQIEEATRRPVLSSENAKQMRQGRRDELQPRLLDAPDESK